MIRKALLISFQSNAVEQADVDCFARGLGDSVQVDRLAFQQLSLFQALRLRVEDYDLVVLWPMFNSLWSSKPGALDILRSICSRTRPGALALALCDTTLPIQTRLWNKEDGPDAAGEPLKEFPVKVLASFHPDVLTDPVAVDRIERIWMSRLHPDSTFIAVEWLAWSVYLPTTAPPTPRDVGAFYYGLAKKGIVPSLTRLGLGEGKNDAVFGKIASLFLDVRDVTDRANNWQQYAAGAERNLFPFDPVKSDYQITRRLLELVQINPESIAFDDRISGYVRQYVDLDQWRRLAEQVTHDFDETFGG